ncbi:AraC family transcriptional regulator [Pseudonocardia sp. P1]|nr:Transcriptional regulator, AraC family [Pseudonocardia sp. Ae707_Ps1]
MTPPAGARPDRALPVDGAGPATISIGPGWAAYIGPSLGLAPHRGAVTCLAVGVGGPLTVEADGTVLVARTVLVPAGLRHRVRSAGERTAFLYLDPGTAARHGCRDRMAGATGPLAHDHADETSVVASAVSGDAIALRRTAAGAGNAAGPADPRILDALRDVRRPGGADLPTDELARRAGLSPARFRRSFAAEAGIGIRGYRRWARMIVVAQVVAAGGDLTRAAADAGFATPSHLSHAFRQMFGLRPSQVLDAGGRIRVRAPDDRHVRDSAVVDGRARLTPAR